MPRTFYPYWGWEDYENGMWRKILKGKEPRFFRMAVKFTGNHALYGSFMIKVLEQYPRACEQFLANPSINRRAWIGHAACNIAIGCPEYITRRAWKELSEEQKRLANNEADKAILKWENEH